MRCFDIFSLQGKILERIKHFLSVSKIVNTSQ